MATAKKTPAKKTPAKKAAPAKKHTARGLKQDRALVAASQPYEVAYVAKKAGVSTKTAKAAAKKAGPSRKAVMKKLGK